jgi:dTDP-4-dehydrorhamnose 3,5-epimerase
MIFHETGLDGAFVIEIEKWKDDRGFFSRLWCRKEYEDNGLNSSVAQINVGYSIKKGTLRGLHYQVAPHEEVKIIRCTKGAIYDVIVDLRPSSPTYMQWISKEISEDDRLMIYVPEGFAQGYITLTDNTEIYYQASQFFAPESARGIRYDDPAFGIRWPATVTVISDADRRWPNWKN